jgi:adenylate cyclase
MNKDRVERRLAAILAADVVGYSRLMEANEERTMAALRQHRKDLFDPTVAKFGGRIFKVMGDGFLIEFASVIEAARCGIEIQSGMKKRNSDIPEDQHVTFRIGINLGDIIVEGEDFYGDGVNLAARLESLALPGGIACSAIVRNQVGNKLKIEFLDQGEKTVKNISQPVHVFFFDLGTSVSNTGPTEKSPGKTRREKPSVAVLPFVNMSNDPEQEFFASGIVEDLITALSRFPWLSVTSRNSSFAYAGKTEALPKIAKELDVRYILEGSVRSSSTRLRVSVKLLDAVEDYNIWAENYDRPVGDLFDLQDDISQSITGMLVPALSSDEQKRLLRNNYPSLNAWESYQKGLAHYYQPFSVENHRKTRALFDQSITQDPHFSEAYAMIAMMGIYSLDSGQTSYTLSRGEILNEARIAATKAVQLDERNPIAHIALGRILEVSGKIEEGIAACKTAVRLNPNLATAHHELGFVQSYAGLLKEAAESHDRAIHLSPNDPARWNYYLMKGMALFGLSEFQNSIEAFEEAVRLRETAIWNHLGMGASLVGLGRMDEARDKVKDILEIRPDCTGVWIMSIIGHGRSTHWQSMVDSLVLAGLPKG